MQSKYAGLEQALKKSDALVAKAKAWERFARPGGWVAGGMTGMSLAMAYQGYKDFAYTTGAAACVLTVLFAIAASIDLSYVIRATRTLRKARKKYGLD